jgi:uncharacterized protein YdeI (YjbR/CyaY-like superfamily)
MTADEPTAFADAAAFRSWLRRKHATAGEITLRLQKVHAADRGLTYAQALDEALCYGWIDGVRRSLDADSFSVRFTPRKPRSNWSPVNVRHAQRLIAAGRMTGAGLAAFQSRDETRTGVYAFERKTTELPPEYRQAFEAHAEAWAYFQQRPPWYRRTSTHWVMSAKREATRENRLALLIDCSARRTPIPALKR